MSGVRSADQFLRSIRVLRPAHPPHPGSTLFTGLHFFLRLGPDPHDLDRPPALRSPRSAPSTPRRRAQILHRPQRSLGVAPTAGSEGGSPCRPVVRRRSSPSSRSNHLRGVQTARTSVQKPRSARLRAPRRSLRVGRACTSSTDPCGSSRRDVGRGRGSPERDSPSRLGWPWSR
jgi:hypothetical protein